MSESTAAVSEQQQQVSRSVLTAALSKSSVIIEVQRKRQEDEELEAALQERHLKLESLEKCINELHKNQQRAQELHLSFDVFLKDEDADKTVEKAERQRKEVLERKEQIEKLKGETEELMQRKQQLLHQMMRLTVYRNVMEQVVKMTKFKEPELLADHLESQLLLREQLCQRETEAQKQADLQRRAATTLDEQRALLQLQKNNQLSRFQSRLEETRSETLTWERKWNHIQETAAKKTLLLGQIKMATLNIYEMTSDTVEAEEDENMNDTEKQLNKIKMFIQDYKDMVKRQALRGTEKKQRQKVLSAPH